MENQIFEIATTFYKSLVLTNDALWISANKERDLEKFEEAVNKTGMMKSAFAVPLSSVTSISFNEASEQVKVKYLDESSKVKSLSIGFSDSAHSNQFGNYLGNKLGYTKQVIKETQLKPLLLNAMYLLLAIVTTVALGLIDTPAEMTDNGSSRRRNKGAFVKLIADTIGQTGVLIIGGLISAYLAYQLYKRYKNPASETVFTK